MVSFTKLLGIVRGGRGPRVRCPAPRTSVAFSHSRIPPGDGYRHTDTLTRPSLGNTPAAVPRPGQGALARHTGCLSAVPRYRDDTREPPRDADVVRVLWRNARAGPAGGVRVMGIDVVSLTRSWSDGHRLRL